jgi:ketose-bisphosphate aldolase
MAGDGEGRSDPVRPGRQATPGAGALVRRAWQMRTAVPMFNIPYLPMMAPVVEALREARAFGLIGVARLEWVKFHAGSLAAVREEYERTKDERFMRLHVDHVPVIDEDGLRVDAAAALREAVDLGYDSVMIDGSRLPLEENIAETRRIVGFARPAGVPVEAELGAVLGHESGPMPPYEELFATGRGFTNPAEAGRFVRESGADWLSVAIGSVHGAITARRVEKKVEARLSVDRLDRIAEATGVPLVLHGGSGIRRACVLEAIRHGIAKINVGTAIRQPYEAAMAVSIRKAQDAVREATLRVIREDLEVAGTADVINPAGEGRSDPRNA